MIGIMNSTDHIRHAFSPRQMELLKQLVIDEMCRKNKQGELPDEELNYAYNLLAIAIVKKP